MESIFVVRRNAIEYKNGKKNMIIELGPEAQEHGEVLDIDKYKNIVNTELEQQKIKPGKAKIYLTQEITFSKFFKLNKKMLNPREFDRFKDEMPVEPEKAVIKILIGRDKYGAAGVNRDLFQILLDILEEKRWKITWVTLEMFKNKKGKEWDLRY